jgi:predicted nucleotidyltransferase
MILPSSLSPEKRVLLERIVALLSNVNGVRAVVLGGSYACGTQHAGSDLDVAVYYREDDPFRIEHIRAVAAQLAAGGPPEVTDFYGWGAWVNGGAWIHTSVCKVDFLYRNLDQVQRTLTEACQGITQHDYDQQPAYGFYSVIYLAETHVCLPLYDPEGELARLKAQVAVYPPRLKEKLVAGSLWAAEFALIHCAGYAANGDVYATSGALARVSAALTQALFALNETYFMTDKTALAELRGFSLVPPAYAARLSSVLAAPGQTPAELSAATNALRGLWSEVVALTGGSYRPAFNL